MMICLLLGAVASAAPVVVRFGIITDVHYADAPPEGTRVYRDSLPKVAAAVKTFSAGTEGNATDFMIELGDFKDTDASKGCGNAAPPTQICTVLTIGFLQTIEKAMSVFQGPRFHVVGNHDVDILNQSAVFATIHDATAKDLNVEVGGAGYSSWQMPITSNATNSLSDVQGCLVRTDDSADSGYVWVVHPDGTRNWLSAPPSLADALVTKDINVFPKRHGGTGAYVLDAAGSVAAVEQRCSSSSMCPCDPTTGLPKALPLPSAGSTPPIRFITLNADYTDHDVAWSDLNNPSAVPGMSWEKANVPSFQLEWLETQLNAALALQQHVIVFVHYRVDGGPGGPVGTGLGPPITPSNRGWVDDCSLQNAAVLRAVLEQHPGLVLATFSGHDHSPNPVWTRESRSTPMYFTHPALVEGSLAAGRNAYSFVEVHDDCTIVVTGFGDAPNVTAAGPAGHSCKVGQ